MSYLLDALNKSDGKDNHPTPTPQPVMYPQGTFDTGNGTNVYKWISIILALALTLIVGIFLGNKYSLMPAPAEKPMVVAQQPQIPVEIAKPVIKQSVKAEVIEPIQPAVAAVAKEEIPVQQPPIKPEKVEEELYVVSGKPKKLKQVDELDKSELGNISSDLMQKFNDAIKDSEGTEPEEVKPAQNDLEDYFTDVPDINDLSAQDQARVPTLIYETHLYSSDIDQRWVKINGKTRQEQQWVNEDIQVLEIQRQFLILQMGDIRFSLASLTDWESIAE